MLHVNDGLQTTAVHLTVGPFVQRQGAAQHVGVIHHRQESAAEVTQHTPVKTVLRGRIAGQRRGAQVTDDDTGRGGFHHRIKHGTLQRTPWQLAIGTGQRQRQALVFRYRVVIKGFSAEDKPGVM
ncbi:hypothetical protein D3C85_1306670 [compost metagenome]